MGLVFWKKHKEKNQTKNSNIELKTSKEKSPWNNVLKFLQDLGKALQFPISVLPFAAILNRFGALGLTFTTTTDAGVMHVTNEVGYWISYIIQQPGKIVFDNLPLLFALGLAFGLAKDHRGEAALVGAVFYLAIAAMTSIEHSLPEMLYKNVLTFTSSKGEKFSSLFYVEKFGTDGKTIIGGIYVLNIGVFGGIVAGCLSAVLYNKYKEIKLPQALSFFGGRRFAPMVALAITIPTALAFAIVWPWIQLVLMKFGQLVANPNNPAVAIPGTAVYGILNRLLLPFGLHQILNTFFWFQLPINGQIISPITGAASGTTEWVNGDINAFTRGIEGSGFFQSGFFPIMMGGIPAAALAMIMAAKKENRKMVSGFLGGVALVSFISGITEPIEFSFVFIAPLLLVIHALLTGIFIAITTALHIQVGFGFSAGIIDYCISFAQSWGFANHATGAYHITSNPLWVLLLIVAAGGVYFIVFYTLITKMNIETPGREEDFGVEESKVTTKSELSNKNLKSDKYTLMATKLIEAIGADNFVEIDNCATRLRLIVKDTSRVNLAKVKAAGAFGTKILSKEALQIVIGTDVEHVANAIKAQLQNSATLNIKAKVNL
ncbi:PTS transporter subunit EIIC [Spiroplasma endosymbiont of Tricholauxania praeusta]|uniref:PTS transporter subunit EIIC n=1 Tax=Spiroplasma endosymbiont of Tricholauxania praeusta TaxID=3066296 RepID=UPI0030D37F87